MLSKSQVMIFIFDELMTHRRIYSSYVTNEYEISIRTFQRYLAEINEYFRKMNKDHIIVYNKEEKCYVLKQSR